MAQRDQISHGVPEPRYAVSSLPMFLPAILIHAAFRDLFQLRRRRSKLVQLPRFARRHVSTHRQ